MSWCIRLNFCHGYKGGITVAGIHENPRAGLKRKSPRLGVECFGRTSAVKRSATLAHLYRVVKVAEKTTQSMDI
jgi:hypothetical protein